MPDFPVIEIPALHSADMGMPQDLPCDSERGLMMTCWRLDVTQTLTATSLVSSDGITFSLHFKMTWLVLDLCLALTADSTLRLLCGCKTFTDERIWKQQLPTTEGLIHKFSR